MIMQNNIRQYQRQKFENIEKVKSDMIKYNFCVKYLNGSFEFYNDEIKNIIKNYVLNPKSLYIAGPIGTGKSTLATLICMLIYQRFLILPKYIYSNQLTKLIINDIDKYDEIKTAGVLVIDDLGVEYASEFQIANYDELIEYRWSNNMITIITSNVKLEDLKLRAGWERIADRLNDVNWINVVYLLGNSLRGKNQSIILKINKE